MKERKATINLSVIVFPLTFIFIVLKLIGAIHWNWIVVLCPIWGYLLFEFSLIFLVGLLAFVLSKFTSHKRIDYNNTTDELYIMQKELYEALQMECDIDDKSNKEIKDILKQLKKADKIIRKNEFVGIENLCLIKQENLITY